MSACWPLLLALTTASAALIRLLAGNRLVASLFPPVLGASDNLEATCDIGAAVPWPHAANAVAPYDA